MDTPPPRTIPYDQPLAVANPNATKALALGRPLNSATRRFITAETELDDARQTGASTPRVERLRRVERNAYERMNDLVTRYQQLLNGVADTGLVLRVEALVDGSYSDDYWTG
jgi:hypothetical protein